MAASLPYNISNQNLNFHSRELLPPGTIAFSQHSEPYLDRPHPGFFHIFTMSTSSVQVLGISTVDSDLSSIDHEQKSESQLKVHGRIKVFENYRSFDTVRISLKGRIKTCIGAKTAVERLPSSILVKRNVDFKPSYSASQQAREEQQLDFVLPLPQTRTGAEILGARPPPPSSFHQCPFRSHHMSHESRL